MAPPLNFLGTKGNRLVVECEGHVYSVPMDYMEQLQMQPQQLQSTRSDSGVQSPRQFSITPAPNVEEETKDVVSECSSELSTSEFSGGIHASIRVPTLTNSAGKVLSELKDEVTRLIDESIMKIELDLEPHAAPTKVPSVVESVEDRDISRKDVEPFQFSVETSKALHPDGDRSQPGYRRQNLQVLQTDMFVASKRYTRVRLLDEILERLRRLKDLETLE
ncbi:uncharacterized protein LOC128725006 [Anopheles nili]|uniref:uncharacterized protein LOC128725006 n=1 Tax=Anopheles nili TaxID=185578 RepID=UPI00237A5710|nr:uncharacterized protein LOC128725006 [Anopheles nili]